MSVQYIDQTYLEMICQKALKDRTLVLNDYVATESIYKLTYYMDKIKKFDDMNKTPKEDRVIIIELSSGGGSCDSGFFLCSKMLKFINEYGYEIVTRINEIACSMAFMIFICGSKREMYRFSEVMFHQPLSASWDYEKLQDLEERTNHMQKTWIKCKNLAKERTLMTDEQMDNCKQRKEDWYMECNEALELQVATHII